MDLFVFGNFRLDFPFAGNGRKHAQVSFFPPISPFLLDAAPMSGLGKGGGWWGGNNSENVP